MGAERRFSETGDHLPSPVGTSAWRHPGRLGHHVAAGHCDRVGGPEPRYLSRPAKRPRRPPRVTGGDPCRCRRRQALVRRAAPPRSPVGRVVCSGPGPGHRTRRGLVAAAYSLVDGRVLRRLGTGPAVWYGNRPTRLLLRRLLLWSTHRVALGSMVIGPQAPGCTTDTNAVDRVWVRRSRRRRRRLRCAQVWTSARRMGRGGSCDLHHGPPRHLANARYTKVEAASSRLRSPR